jgi:hypothetical protein
MREIKFRLWWILEKKMEYSPKINEFHSLNSQFNGGSSVTIPLQYTGLKDKNNKEIFEGDIVNREYNQDLGIVSFINGCFVANFIYSEIDDSGILLANENSVYSVIGNIYENPGLLNNE